jgi:hypothetical protein
LTISWQTSPLPTSVRRTCWIVLVLTSRLDKGKRRSVGWLKNCNQSLASHEFTCCCHDVLAGGLLTMWIVQDTCLGSLAGPTFLCLLRVRWAAWWHVLISVVWSLPRALILGIGRPLGFKRVNNSLYVCNSNQV